MEVFVPDACEIASL